MNITNGSYEGMMHLDEQMENLYLGSNQSPQQEQQAEPIVNPIAPPPQFDYDAHDVLNNEDYEYDYDYGQNNGQYGYEEHKENYDDYDEDDFIRRQLNRQNIYDDEDEDEDMRDLQEARQRDNENRLAFEERERNRMIAFREAIEQRDRENQRRVISAQEELNRIIHSNERQRPFIPIQEREEINNELNRSRSPSPLPRNAYIKTYPMRIRETSSSSQVSAIRRQRAEPIYETYSPRETLLSRQPSYIRGFPDSSQESDYWNINDNSIPIKPKLIRQTNSMDENEYVRKIKYNKRPQYIELELAIPNKNYNIKKTNTSIQTRNIEKRPFESVDINERQISPIRKLPNPKKIIEFERPVSPRLVPKENRKRESPQRERPKFLTERESNITKPKPPQRRKPTKKQFIIPPKVSLVEMEDVSPIGTQRSRSPSPFTLPPHERIVVRMEGDDKSVKTISTKIGKDLNENENVEVVIKPKKTILKSPEKTFNKPKETILKSPEKQLNPEPQKKQLSKQFYSLSNQPKSLLNEIVKLNKEGDYISKDEYEKIAQELNDVYLRGANSQYMKPEWVDKYYEKRKRPKSGNPTTTDVLNIFQKNVLKPLGFKSEVRVSSTTERRDLLLNLLKMRLNPQVVNELGLDVIYPEGYEPEHPELYVLK